MQELYENLLRLGIAEDPAAKMAQYGQKVAEANAHFNLTRILDPADMAESHFVDSIDAARKGYIPADAHIIDIGTGAGFPGVPLAIFLPEAKVTLLDSSEKKTDFIRETCTALGIPVQVVCGRSEELARREDFFQAFDIAVARAVARLNILLELCAPYVRMGAFWPIKAPARRKKWRKPLLQQSVWAWNWRRSSPRGRLLRRIRSQSIAA